VSDIIIDVEDMKQTNFLTLQKFTGKYNICNIISNKTYKVTMSYTPLIHMQMQEIIRPSPVVTFRGRVDFTTDKGRRCL
jgi:hypothetical protein